MHTDSHTKAPQMMLTGLKKAHLFQGSLREAVFFQAEGLFHCISKGLTLVAYMFFTQSAFKVYNISINFRSMRHFKI